MRAVLTVRIMTMTQDPQTPTAAGPSHWTGINDDSVWMTRARELQEPLAARAVIHDEAGTFVGDGFDLLREAGLMPLLVPSSVGGGAASHREACAVLSELARACPATSLLSLIHI